MDETAALAIDGIVHATVTMDGKLVLLRLNAGGREIDLAFPIGKAEELAFVLTQAGESAARKRFR